MSRIEILQAEALSEASASPGIIRHLAFKGEDHLVLRARSDSGVISGWHHHGDYDVYGYVVSGSVRLGGKDGDQNSISLKQGDFFHVPPHTVHREINPSSEEGNEVILFLCGSGPLVVNMDDSEKT